MYNYNYGKSLFFVLILTIIFFSNNQKAFSQAGDIIWGVDATTSQINGGNGAAPPTDVFPNVDGVTVTVNYDIQPSPPTQPLINAAILNAGACPNQGTAIYSETCPGLNNLVPNWILYEMNVTGNTDNCTVSESITIDFDPPVTNPFFTVTDIDTAGPNGLVPPNGWQDVVIVTGLDDSSNPVTPSSSTLIGGGSAVTAELPPGLIPSGFSEVCELNPNSVSCPGTDACFHGIGNVGQTGAGSDAGNVLLEFTGDISQITLTYYSGNIGNQGGNPSGQFIGISSIEWTDTLPITLASIESSYAEGGLRLDWSTSTETMNIGFNVYAYIDGEKVIINDEMIPSHEPNSLDPQYYEKTVAIPEGVTQIGISSVDISGHEDYFGPYEVGGSYGSEPVSKKIDWKKIKEKYNQKMAGKGFEMRAGKMRAPAPEEPGLVSNFLAKVGVGNSPVCNVAVIEEGMVRVRQRDLRRAGCDFRGEDIDDIAVTFKGEPVSRRIKSNSGKIKNGTNIFFYADTPKERDFLYTTENVYQVSVDPDLADIHEDVSRPKNRDLSGYETSYMHEVKVEKNITYDFVTPYGKDGSLDEIDPWYEENIFASTGSPNTYTYDVPVHSDVDTTRDGKLKLRLIGVTDFPEETIDHEVSVKVNTGTPSTHQGEGRLNWFIEDTVGGSDLTPGTSQIEVEVTGNLPVFDFMHTDSYGLMYWRPAASIDDLLSFTEHSPANGYSASEYSVKNVQAYGEKDGQLYKLKTKKKNNGGSYTVSFKSLGEGARYWVSPVSEFNEGEVTKADEGDIKNGSADVIIITHPGLSGSELDAYESYVSNEGYTTKVVNVLNIFDGFGYGMPTPEGIRSYLEYAKDNLNVEYAAIVGGTTTEYPDPLVMESIQYVPTEFERTHDLLYFTPCDGCMADFNGDFVPELKIFRIPSRQTSDTGAVANKSNAYNTDSSALLLAENTQEQNFGAQLDAVSNQLGGYDAMKIYLSDIQAENGGLNLNDAICVAQLGADCPACTAGMPCASMTGYIEQINDGKRLIMMNGHASITEWVFAGLMDTAIAGNLNNAVPNVVIPMACYTTYYENPGTASLADQLLFNQNGGSVAVSGAATLSSLSDNGVFAESILNKMCDGTTTLAEAIYETKKENPGLTDQVINWDLIGNGFVTIAECEEVVPEPPVIIPPGDEIVGDVGDPNAEPEFND